MVNNLRHRPLRQIAHDIFKDWNKAPKGIYFGAVPYLEAMQSLDQVTENYYADTGSSVVSYFLANAQRWRGPVAKKVKDELNQILKQHGGR